LKSDTIPYVPLKIQRAFTSDSMEGAAHVIFFGISAMIMTCVALVIKSN